MNKTQMLAHIALFSLSTQNYSMEKHSVTHEVREEIGTIAELFSPKLGKFIKGELPAIAHNQYKHIQATVREGGCVSKGEQSYLDKRLPIVRTVLEKALDRSLEGKYIPKIAIIASGGGYRSALCTTGSLNGAAKICLLDATTYMCTLSGSTWTYAPLISTQLTVKKFKDYIKECTEKRFCDLTHQERHLIADMIAVKKEYDQTCTLTDPYGAFLANRLLHFFEDQKQMVYLSQQADIIANGHMPYPIYTAVDARNLINPNWYTYTPHEIGNLHKGCYVPAWSYGREFNNGTSIDYAPEQSLGFHMGTWGSAFGASIRDVEEEIAEYVSKPEKMFRFLKPIEGVRLPFYAKVFDYAFGTDNQACATKNTIKAVDAGTHFNLPYPPVSGLDPERQADILIFLDNSAGTIGEEFEKTVHFAREHELPFPDVDFKNIGNRTLSIFKDENDINKPVVMYMPRISDHKLWEKHKADPVFNKYHLSGFDLDKETNDGFAETIHFHYTQEHATLVVNQTEFNMRVNRDAIFHAINWLIDKRS